MVAATCISRRSSGSASSHSAMCSARSRTSAARVDLAQQRRRLAHRDRARAERLDARARSAPARRARATQPLDVGLVELDDLRDQQNLPRDAGLLERGLHALVDDALMRGVLVDDDEAVARLRHDVGLVHLRARGAERPVEQIGRGLGALDARVGRRPRRRRTPPARLRQSRAGAAPCATRCASAAAAPASAASRRRRAAAAPTGRNAAMVALPPVVAARWPSRASASFSARTISAAHQPAVAEAHLGLGRMHVDVDLARLERDEQRQQRMAVARQIIGIGARAPRRSAACRAPGGR